MTVTEIINARGTKKSKMIKLFEMGKTRIEVSQLLGCGYGHVQNVYAQRYPERINARRTNTRRVQAAVRAYQRQAFDRKFGVEIECYGTTKAEVKREINRLGVACEVERYNHRTRSQWKIVTDSSLRASRGEAFEVVSPILRGQDGIEQLEKVCQALENCRVLINKSCGLHIHFDASEFQLATWKNLFQNYLTCESTIDSMMPRSRRGSANQYCKSLMKKFSTISEAKQAIKSARNIESISSVVTNRSRYFKINAESYFRQKSVEFRQHSGTREFKKIKNWIMFLHDMVSYSEQGFVLENGNFENMTAFMNDDNHAFYNNRIEDLAA